MDTGDRTVYLAAVLKARLVDPRPVLTAARLIELVPAETRAEMKAQREYDAALDTEAIREWRRATHALSTTHGDVGA
jgi:hypothetical protein